MENLDYRAMAFWFDMAQVIAMLMVGIYAVLSNRHKANTTAIDKVREEINNLDDRLIRAEEHLGHLPTHEDMKQLHTRINEAAQRLTSVEGELKQITTSLALIHQHLLNGSKA